MTESDTYGPGGDLSAGQDGAGEDVCPVCSGSGRVDDQQCQTCGGTGKLIEPVGGA
jgi:DnaJ-class molecular chaperone